MGADGPAQALSLETRVRQSGAQVHVSVQDSTVILSLDRNTYFSLNEIGSLVWGLMGAPVSVATCCGAVVERYDVDAARCEADVLALVQELIAAGLVELV
jgi:hypothetical protein